MHSLTLSNLLKQEYLYMWNFLSDWPFPFTHRHALTRDAVKREYFKSSMVPILLSFCPLIFLDRLSCKWMIDSLILFAS